MLKITVHSDNLRRQAFVSKTTGKPGELYFQTLYLHTVGEDGKPNPFPEKVEVIAERDAQGNPAAFPRGEHTLHPSSIQIDRNGRIAVVPRLTSGPKA